MSLKMPSASLKHSRQSSPEDTNSRKRVGKACDRCRLKKSKCDGLLPCQRCLVDDQICVFSERKRAKDKTYPKGYVELLESRTQTLADALHKVLYCQQRKIDISHVIPQEGKIVINEVLANLESVRRLPDGVSNETYTDDLLQQFIIEQRARDRQSSLHSDPESLLSDNSSRDEDFPHSPEIESLSPTFTFDGQYLSQQPMTKMPFYNDMSNLPTSISPSLLLPDYGLSHSPIGVDLDYNISEDQILSDPGWY